MVDNTSKPEDKKSVSAPVFQRELEALEPDQQKRERILSLFLSHFSVSIESFESHSGPLPSPQMLKKYDEILPGLAERIVGMAERQSAHRIEIEKKAIDHKLGESKRGQDYGLIIGVVGIVSAGILSFADHDIVAGIIGGSTVVGLVTTFVVGKIQQKTDLAAKKN
ncbi:MAG TPA: DUF2335 domain-containing protein [Bacteroidota bacterium]|nr:DUF2335 domain-containing protein [Bacteroidota bacterium]